MHSVALTPEGEVWTTGVNDEGALGRETGTHVLEGTFTLQEEHAMGEAHKKMSCGGVLITTWRQLLQMESSGPLRVHHLIIEDQRIMTGCPYIYCPG
jgi:alpha-tubulin suppressor-like RCC1 family protein